MPKDLNVCSGSIDYMHSRLSSTSPFLYVAKYFYYLQSWKHFEAEKKVMENIKDQKTSVWKKMFGHENHVANKYRQLENFSRF